MLNKSLNHKSIMAAFEDVCEEFTQMSESQFKAMLDGTELDALGSLLYETNTVTGYTDVRECYVNIAVDAFNANAIIHRDYMSYVVAASTFSTPSDNYMSDIEGGSWLKAA